MKIHGRQSKLNLKFKFSSTHRIELNQATFVVPGVHICAGGQFRMWVQRNAAHKMLMVQVKLENKK